MTILIVDDNEPNLYQLQVLLSGNGYQVVSAANGAEALTKARQNPPDLVVSDILMPVMDGFALCREWKKDERLRQIPFVFYTATYTDEHDREFALSLGAERFLVKPVETKAFMRTILEVIQQVQRPPAAPTRVPIEAPQQEEVGYLKQYNEVLIRKLEAKMEQLEQVNRELERDITERKKAEAELKKSEQELREDKLLLEQKNLALAELLEHMERTKNKTKEDIAINVEEFITPILKKLKIKGALPKYIKLLEHHLKELTSSFGRKITQRSTRLSSREIEICDMIKGGLSSKEISELLNVSYQTIDKHRRNIRKKLAIAKKKVNLTSFLQKL